MRSGRWNKSAKLSCLMFSTACAIPATWECAVTCCQCWGVWVRARRMRAFWHSSLRTAVGMTRRPELAFALASLHDARAVAPIVQSLGDQAAARRRQERLERGRIRCSVHRQPEQAHGHGVRLRRHRGRGDADWISAPNAKRWKNPTDEEDSLPGVWANPDDLNELEVVYDASGIARCPDCGAVMHRVEGRWEHPMIDEPFMPPQRPIRAQAIGRNDPCPCGSGKKYKHCHGSTSATTLN